MAPRRNRCAPGLRRGKGDTSSRCGVSSVIDPGGASSRPGAIRTPEHEPRASGVSASPASIRGLLAQLQLRDVIVLVGPDPRITYASPPVESLLGAPAAACAGRAFLDLVAPEDRARVATLLGDLAGGALRAPAPAECRVLHADGATRLVEIAGTQLADASGTPQLLLLLRDVAEKRALERQLQQVQRIETVGNVAAGIAHDFNNLLTAILGWSGSLVDSLPPAEPGHRLAREIHEASRQAADLAARLLSLRRHRTVERTLVNPNEIVLRAGTLLRRLLGPQIDCVLRLTPGVGAVEADPTQIEQVLLNLALNARDAMPDGGQLIIETAPVRPGASELRDLPPGDYVRLSVRDTGVGIDEAVRPRIFDPSYTTKPEGQGSGLGLFIVRSIVQQHGGCIDVQSRVGAGTTFRIVLPKARGAPASEKTAGAEGTPPARPARRSR